MQNLSSRLVAGTMILVGSALSSAAMAETCSGDSLPAKEVSWNKFKVPKFEHPVPVVWINAHIDKPKGIPTDAPSKLRFSNVRLTVVDKSGAALYDKLLPSGVVNFVPDALSETNYTDSLGVKQWTTTINSRALSDEIFFTGAAIPLVGDGADLPNGGKATITFALVAEANNLPIPVEVKWQWSAAVYTNWPGNYADAQILPVHASRHAGTPMDRDVQKSLIGGPRGGGGSNFTGSWSSTGKLCTPVPQPPQ